VTFGTLASPTVDWVEVEERSPNRGSRVGGAAPPPPPAASALPKQKCNLRGQKCNLKVLKLEIGSAKV
jgi:hypothetical protein